MRGGGVSPPLFFSLSLSPLLYLPAHSAHRWDVDLVGRSDAWMVGALITIFEAGE